MIYSIIKLVIYIVSVVLSMYGLSAINFPSYIQKNKVTQFYCLYLVLSISIAYLFASFILSFITIRIG